MADFPYLPLFTDAITADCHHLSDAEFGLYIRLLITMWRCPGCRIPNDDAWISRRLGDLEGVKKLVSEFCQSDGNWITQKRLTKEKKWAVDNSQRQSVRAKSRWNKEKALCRGNAGAAMPPHPHSQLDNTPPLSPPTQPPQAGVKNHGQKLSPARAAAKRGLEAVNRKFGFDAGE